MQVLAVDVGTGTQDILLFDSHREIENCIQLIMPSPTMLVAEQVRRATAAGQAVLLVGVTMGGGPSMWAVEDHLRAGGRAYATAPAAQSFDDDLDRIAELGIVLVSDDEAGRLAGVRRVETRDFSLEPILGALRAFGVEPALDAAAVAVFDHGAAPPGYSDRKYRFEYLARALAERTDLTSFGHLRGDIPPFMTRLAAVASTVPPELPLLVMDTGPAAALGALEDSVVARHEPGVLVNVGNFHTLAFHFDSGRIVGLFEHHTGELTAEKLVGYLRKLATGEITNREVFDDMGHGALVLERTTHVPSFFAVTGPRRALLAGTEMAPYFAVPFGDMMLAGCFGLLRAFAARRPDVAEPIADAFRRSRV